MWGYLAIAAVAFVLMQPSKSSSSTPATDTPVVGGQRDTKSEASAIVQDVLNLANTIINTIKTRSEG